MQLKQLGKAWIYLNINIPLCLGKKDLGEVGFPFCKEISRNAYDCNFTLVID